MNSKIILIISMACMILLISLCHGTNNFPSNNDENRFDISNHKSNDHTIGSEFVERDTRKGCVKCKFGIGRCCAPNICRKKFLRPDQCIRIKEGK